MNVMQIVKPAKSKIKPIYRKSSFMRKLKLINVLPSQRICEINVLLDSLDEKCNLA